MATTSAMDDRAADGGGTGGAGGVRVAGWSVPACAALVALLLAPAPSGAQEIYLTAGTGLYESDEFCLESGTALSSWRFGMAGSKFGASLSYEDEDWPWPDPPPPGSTGVQQIALRHGSAAQIVAEAYPLGLFDLEDSRLARFVRPFVGAGLHVAKNGETDPEGPDGLPVYSVLGRTDVILTAGARLTARPAFLPFGIELQYRATSLFGSDFQFESPEGVIVTEEGSQTLLWGELTAGLSFELGG